MQAVRGQMERGKGQNGNERQKHVRDVLVGVLSFTSGFIDAVAYLSFGNVFVSNMTGNTIFLGLAIAGWRLSTVTRSLTSLLGFILGVAIGAYFSGPTVHEEYIWPRAAGRAFGLELLVLMVFTIFGLSPGSLTSWTVYPLIALAAIAMGIQSVGALTIGVTGVVTTYITSTWTVLVSTLARREVPKPDTTSSEKRTHDDLVPQATVLIVYVIAAAVAYLLELSRSMVYLIIPALGMVVVISVSRTVFGRR